MIRSAPEAFSAIAETKIKGEMLDLARHIIETKRGTFDPRQFDDPYETALTELVKAKREGRLIPVPKAPQQTNVIDLMVALRQSVAAVAGGKPPFSVPAPGKRARKQSSTEPKSPGIRRRAPPVKKTRSLSE
jgi:DNA end-binding protein Ku